MSGLPSSYIGQAGRRQPVDVVQRRSPPFIRAAVIAAAVLSVAGCARLGLPFEGVSAETTGSIASARPVIAAKITSGVDPSDWQTVRQALAGMASSGTGRDGVDWRNPNTGSAGTITAYAAEETSAGLCRAFATTVSDLRGVRRYRGQACIRNGDWKLTGVAPEDGKLL